MNQQIHDLLIISTENISGVSVVNQEMFAKLIVKECANICFNLKFTHEGPGEVASYQRTLCGVSIEENFGLVSKGPITALNIK